MGTFLSYRNCSCDCVCRLANKRSTVGCSSCKNCLNPVTHLWAGRSQGGAVSPQLNQKLLIVPRRTTWTIWPQSRGIKSHPQPLFPTSLRQHQQDRSSLWPPCSHSDANEGRELSATQRSASSVGFHFPFPLSSPLFHGVQVAALGTS